MPKRRIRSIHPPLQIMGNRSEGGLTFLWGGSWAVSCCCTERNSPFSPSFPSFPIFIAAVFFIGWRRSYDSPLTERKPFRSVLSFSFLSFFLGGGTEGSEKLLETSGICFQKCAVPNSAFLFILIVKENKKKSGTCCRRGNFFFQRVKSRLVRSWPEAAKELLRRKNESPSPPPPPLVTIAE